MSEQSFGNYEEYFYGPSEEDMKQDELLPNYKIVICPVCNEPVIVELSIITPHFRKVDNDKYKVWDRCSGSERIVS